MLESKLKDRFGNSQEEIIVERLKRKGYTEDIILETCRELILETSMDNSSLDLEMDLVKSALDKYPEYLMKSEERRTEIIPTISDFSKFVAGSFFAIPTAIRKYASNAGELFIMVPIAINFAMHSALLIYNPKIEPVILGIQIVTNLVSAGYEIIRALNKKRSLEKVSSS
jgi:hypothetical protein